MNRPPQSSRAELRTVAPALAALAAGGFALGLALGEPEVVAADVTSAADLDSDGLTDEVELILGTSPFTQDTDNDGFGDLEEVARHSDPLINSSAPGAEAVAVGMVGRVSGGYIDLVIPIYLDESDLTGLDFRFGMRGPGQQLIEISPTVWLPVTSYTIHPGADPKDSVLTLKLQVPAALVSPVDGLGLYATATPNGKLGPTTSAVLNLVSSGSIIMQVIDIEDTGNGLSSAYRPINDSPEIPSSWAPGELCSRSTNPIGSVGSIVIQEVTDARCEVADGFCVPTCVDSIGEQEELIDPLALLGG